MDHTQYADAILKRVRLKTPSFYGVVVVAAQRTGNGHVAASVRVRVEPAFHGRLCAEGSVVGWPRLAGDQRGQSR